MENPPHMKLTSLILSLYKGNIGLFLRIMLPVAIIAIILNISLYYYQVSRIEKINPELLRNQVNSPSLSETNNIDPQENSVSVRINTNGGITPFPYEFYKLLSSTRPQYPWNPNEIGTTDRTPLIWQILPYPMIGYMDDLVTWAWSLSFLIIAYNPLILLFFTLYPLSIVVAGKLPNSQIGDISPEITSLSVHSVWKHTLNKPLKVLIVPILLILIIEACQSLYALSFYVIPNVITFHPNIMFLIVFLPKLYFLVTLSLYNQSTIFENRSIIDIFKRSHSLVKGVRLKFLSIYLLTAGVAAIVSSVLLGSTFFVLSLFFTELAPIQNALTPFRFLSLFIGADVAVLLPDKLSILPTVLILIVSGIISTLIVPLWAIVTTHLYNERLGSTPTAIEV